MATSESNAMKKNRIGAHVPTSGGLVKRALGYAQTIGAETIQIFASNPRGWAMPDGNPAADKEFRDKAEAMDIATYIHAPFLINLGSPTEATYENSLASTEYSLKRSRELGARGTVIHTGSAVKEEFVAQAWKQIHDGMMPILEKLTSDDPFLLLEPTAGQGQSLVRRLDELIKYFDALEHHPQVGICIDTCHVFAAGHDITTGKGIDEMLGALTAVVPSDRIKLVHANDSMDVCGSLKDRHQSIGEGHIGQRPFQLLMAHPAMSGVPFILETPGEEPEHGNEVKILKKLRG
jgi:deoxyribonuclease-4